MKFYELSEALKKRMAKELDQAPNKATFHGAISREVYPDLKTSALLIGDKLQLTNYN